MNLLICLVGPSLVGIKLFEKLDKSELSKRNYIIYFLLIVFLVNLFSSIFSVLFLGASTSIEESLKAFPIYSLKYIFISIIFSIIIPIVIQTIRKNISFNLEVKKNDKKN